MSPAIKASAVVGRLALGLSGLLLAVPVGASPYRSPAPPGLAARNCASAFRLLSDNPPMSYEMLRALYAQANPPALGRSIDADNADFIALASSPRGRDLVYVHATLKALKRLNDKVFTGEELSGKEDVNAARNLFRVLLHENLEAHPELHAALVGRFMDFKSTELAFDPSRHPHPERLEADVNEVLTATQIQFEQAMLLFGRANPALPKAILRERGIAGDFRAWHAVGLARGNPDHAALAARFASRGFEADGPGPRLSAVRFDPARVEAQVTEIETVLKPRLLRELGADSPVFARYENTNHHVLSPDAIDILRRVDAGSLDEYVQKVTAAFERRLGVRLTREQVVALRDIFARSDDLQPSIRVAKRSSIHWQKAEQGGISVDFAAQNVFNMYHTMGAIAEAHRRGGRGGVSVGETAVELSRIGEERATRRLVALRNAFDGARRAAGFGGEYEASGDDGAVFLHRQPTEQDRANLYRALATSGEAPSLFRIVWVPPQRDTRGAIDPAAMARASAKGEDFEKGLRQALYGRLPAAVLRDIGVASQIDPVERTLRVEIFGRVTAEQETLLRARIAAGDGVPDGYRVVGVSVVR